MTPSSVRWLALCLMFGCGSSGGAFGGWEYFTPAGGVSYASITGIANPQYGGGIAPRGAFDLK